MKKKTAFLLIIGILILFPSCAHLSDTCDTYCLRNGGSVLGSSMALADIMQAVVIIKTGPPTLIVGLLIKLQSQAISQSNVIFYQIAQ